ncbi:MAG TPA: efflux RND transporter permease subunit [Bacteroidetes bacterium]|nr:efflux RND transporter permease subunit [Bacteroidota bacterium]
MSIYKQSVQRPITTLMIFIGLVVLGIYSLARLPIDFYPELEFPAISVYTVYSGAGAEDIETNVTRVIEDNLNTVSNLKEISSVSRDNISIVSCEFEWGTNMDEAANEIREALSLAEQALPEEVEDPSIFKFSSSLMPIMVFAVTADESYAALEKILEEKIINPLNRIEGIGAIGTFGAPAREVQVTINPRKMEAYHLTIEQVAAVLNAENLNMPAGHIEMGMLDYPLRVEGEFTESDQVKEIVLANINGKPVYLRDIATVQDTLRDMTIDERINGKKGVRLIIQKQSGANTVKIARKVNKQLPQLARTLPPDIHIEPIFDTSDFITGSINNLSQTLLFALFFVVMVVLFFLGRWRATFIVVITIPISLIVAFIYLYLTGNTINIISLSSLSIAIGMVVDDAIVVLENITKHIERGSRPREAAIYATNEVWLAVIVTTLTVVAVFLPLTLVSGMTGELFKQLGWVVSITVVTSTAVAITLTPMLSSKLLKLRPKKNTVRKFSHDNTALRWLDHLDNFYETSLRYALRHKALVLITSLVIFGGSLALILLMGTEFLPEADQGQLSATVELQTGLRVDETVRIARQIDNYINKNIPEYALMSTSAGSDDRGGIFAVFMQSGSNIINYNMRLKDLEERDRSVWDIAEDLRAYLKTIPEIVTYTVTPNGGMGASTDNNVVVEIMGYDLDVTSVLADTLARRFSGIQGARNIEISRDPIKPQLKIIPDREKMARYGINTYNLANQLRNRVEGPYMTKYRETGDEYDIVVRFDEEHRNAISDLESMIITNAQGNGIRLEEVADIIESWSPPNIEHKRKQRIITVSITPYKVPLNVLTRNIQEQIAGVDVPSDVQITVGGAVEDMQESMVDLAMLLILGMVLVYLVMASQFESLRMPFIIMFSIPFAFSGVLLALFITNTTLNLISMVGGVMLVGIVVKNAIVLVDYINLMRDRGNDLTEAIAISGRSRLRPVLMTSMTTILGMLPLALSTGEGSEIWSPMGISVIGGLLLSTMVTLILVPVVYHLFIRRIENKRRRKLTFSFMEESTNRNE